MLLSVVDAVFGRLPVEPSVLGRFFDSTLEFGFGFLMVFLFGRYVVKPTLGFLLNFRGTIAEPAVRQLVVQLAEVISFVVGLWVGLHLAGAAEVNEARDELVSRIKARVRDENSSMPAEERSMGGQIQAANIDSDTLPSEQETKIDHPAEVDLPDRHLGSRGRVDAVRGRPRQLVHDRRRERGRLRGRRRRWNRRQHGTGRLGGDRGSNGDAKEDRRRRGALRERRREDRREKRSGTTETTASVYGADSASSSGSRGATSGPSSRAAMLSTASPS
jgi:hypothetical protein